MSNLLLLAQVIWEKIPDTAQGFIFAIVFMSLFIGVMWVFGVDDHSVVVTP
jgi:hypothetical protein